MQCAPMRMYDCRFVNTFYYAKAYYKFITLLQHIFYI